MNCPCFLCEDRHDNCHAGCDAYKGWAAKLKGVRDARRGYLHAGQLLCEGAVKTIRKRRTK